MCCGTDPRLSLSLLGLAVRVIPGKTCHLWAVALLNSGSRHSPLQCYSTSRGPQSQLLVYKPVPIHGGQGEAKEKGRPLYIGGWQVQ